MTNNGATAYSTAWGVATSGALLFDSVSMNSVDPYFPAVYGSVTNAASATEFVDFCQAHPKELEFITITLFLHALQMQLLVLHKVLIQEMLQLLKYQPGKLFHLEQL